MVIMRELCDMSYNRFNNRSGHNANQKKHNNLRILCSQSRYTTFECEYVHLHCKSFLATIFSHVCTSCLFHLIIIREVPSSEYLLQKSQNKWKFKAVQSCLVIACMVIQHVTKSHHSYSNVAQLKETLIQVLKMC